MKIIKHTKIMVKGRKIHSKDTINKIVSLVEKEHKSYLSISKQLGMSLSTVRQLYVDSKNPNKYNINPWTEEDIEKLKTLVEVEKKNYTELSEIFNRTEGSIQSKVSSLGIKYTGKKSHTKWKYEEIKELQEYLNNKLSYLELEIKFRGRHSLESIKHVIRNNRNLTYQGSTRQVFTREIISKCTKLYVNGYTPKEISEELNIKSISSISKILESEGVRISQINKSKQGFVRGKKDSILLTKDYLFEKISKEKISKKDLAKTLGISVDTISRRCKLFGIEKLPKPKKSDSNQVYLLKKYLNKEILTKEDRKKKVHEVIPRELIEQLISSGLNNSEIAKQLEISVSTLQKCYKLHNITVKGPSLSDFTNDFFKNLYVDQDLGYGDISEITGLAIDTLRKHLKKLFPEHNKKFGKYASFGEKLVGDALDKLGIENQYSYRTEFGTIYKDHRIIIDFQVIVDGQEYWIEYNGEQHYVYSNCSSNMFSKGDPNVYLNQINRDNSIRTYCKNNNIVLIEIPYHYRSLKHIKKILQDIILSKKSPEECIDLAIYSDKIKQSLELIEKLKLLKS